MTGKRVHRHDTANNTKRILRGARGVVVVMSFFLSACGALMPPRNEVVEAKAPIDRNVGAESWGASAANAASAAPPVGEYRVVAGDTLYGIARRHNVPVKQLASLNDLPMDHKVKVGQGLRVPGAAQMAAQTASRSASAPVVQAAPREPVAKAELATPAKPNAMPVATAPAEPLPPLPILEPVSTASPRETPAATPAAMPAVSPAATGPIAAPPARSGAGFLRPVEGRTLVSFGKQPGGLNNDGINVAAPKGTPVKAADNGVVMYAGNELRGFGNLLLVRHAGGWMTAYAHLDTMAVNRGEQVKRGQRIGTVGMTGNVASPQLHFEIRRGKQPVDPEAQVTAAAKTAQLGAAR